MKHKSETQDMDPWTDLATQAVRTFVMSGHALSAPDPIPQEMRGRAGVFVSIKSASTDPRFPPIDKTELAGLTISVDVLSEPEPCDESRLDPSRYGVIVENGWRRGLLLPDLEGVESVEEQVAIARSKAGIHPDEPIRLSRFTVERHQ